MSTPVISAFAGVNTPIGWPDITSFLVTKPACSNGNTVSVSVAGNNASLDSSYTDSITSVRVLVTGPGTITLTATSPGAVAVTKSVSVLGSQTIAPWGSDLPTSITFTPGKAQAYKFVAPTSSSKLVPVVTVQSGPATVKANVVTITGAGTVVLVANQSGNTLVTAATAVTATNSIVVAKSDQTISYNFKTAPDSSGAYNQTYTYGTDKSASIVASATSSLPVTLALSAVTPSGCVTLGSTGTLTVVGAGTATITATQAGNVNFNSATRVAHITVNKASQTITPSALAATYLPSATSNGPIACAATSTSKLAVTETAVTSNLTVASGAFTIATSPTPVNGDVCTLQYSQAGDANYLAAPTITKSFTLQRSNQSFTTLPTVPPAPFRVGNTYTFAAKASSSGAITYSVNSADANTGAVTISGSTITATQAGNVKIYATQVGDLTYNPITASVSIPIRIALQTNTIVFNTPTPSTGNRFVAGGSYTISLPTSTNTNSSPVIKVTGPASLSGNVLKVTGSGAITLTASQAQDDAHDFVAATPVTVSIFAHTTQTISITAKPNASVYSGATGTFTAVSSAGLPVTLSVTSGSATISGSTITFGSTLGPVVITASQDGNSYVDAATSIDTTFTIGAMPTKVSMNVSQFITTGTSTSPVYFIRKNQIININSLISVTDAQGRSVNLAGELNIAGNLFQGSYTFSNPIISFNANTQFGNSNLGGTAVTITWTQVATATKGASSASIVVNVVDYYYTNNVILNIPIASSDKRQSLNLVDFIRGFGGLNSLVDWVYPDQNSFPTPGPERFATSPYPTNSNAYDNQIGWDISIVGLYAVLRSSQKPLPIVDLNTYGAGYMFFLTSAIPDYLGQASSRPNVLLSNWYSHFLVGWNNIKISDHIDIALGAGALTGTNQYGDKFVYTVNLTLSI
jgi:hypothetical protein